MFDGKSKFPLRIVQSNRHSVYGIEENNKMTLIDELLLEAEHSHQSNGHDDGLKQIMEQSLREAVEIMRAFTDVPFQNEDI